MRTSNSALSALSAWIVAVLIALPAEAQATKSYDSAGVHIVVNRPRLSTPISMKPGPKPVLDLGGPAEKHEDEFDGCFDDGTMMSMYPVLRVLTPAAR